MARLKPSYKRLLRRATRLAILPAIVLLDGFGHVGADWDTGPVDIVSSYGLCQGLSVGTPEDGAPSVRPTTTGQLTLPDIPAFELRSGGKDNGRHLRVATLPGRGHAVPPNEYEPAAFAGQDQVVLVGELVPFFGAGASPDAEIVRNTWDFDSDGVQDFLSRQTGFTQHPFTEPGDYRCLLTVEDSVGRIARDTRRIIVLTEPVDSQTAEQMLHPPKRAVVNPPDGVTHRYAIMINGGAEERFWTDVELGYDMLTNGYGFPPSDVHLLNHNGTDPQGGNPGNMIDYSATLTDLETVFDELALTTDEDDEVFIWITGHGRGYSGSSEMYYGYLDGRASVDPGDEPDYLESDFKLRSIFTGGDYRCNHGLNVWKVRRKYSHPTQFYRNKYVSQLDSVYIETHGTTVSDSDIYIERLVDYVLGDTNRDGYVDTDGGEVFDYDGDGKDPYDHETGEFDEDDWGPVDDLEDEFNNCNTVMPVDAYPYKIFDEGFQGKLCIDLGHVGGAPQVNGRDEDNAGLFDWLDANQDGDTLDIVSIDETTCLYSGDLYDDDLADLVNELSVAKLTVVSQPCFSGGLVEDLTSPTRVICTAEVEEATSSGNLFIRAFTAALHGVDEHDLPVNADVDENGYVSMVEAFNYAASETPANLDTPQYDDSGDGVSHAGPIPAGGDGGFGLETYLCAVGEQRIATPAFSPDGGTYYSPQTVAISCAEPSAIIHYTTDNSDPTPTSPLYAGPILVDRRVILKARAYQTGRLPSDVKEAVYFMPGQTVVHVTPDGDDGNEGLTWSAAKETIAAALDAAEPGDDVWVKGDPANPYYGCIVLKEGVALYGGFTGDETSLTERPAFPRPAEDPYETIVDGNQLCSVVESPEGATAITVVDGLSIRNGGAYNGGGIYVGPGSPTLMNCTIIGNSADADGGGVYCASYSNPTMTACKIVDNWAGSSGGGIHCWRGSSPKVRDCIIAGNSSGFRGGGFSCYSYSTYSQPKLHNCAITDNLAGQDGGGIQCRESNLKMTNCTVSGNSSGYSAGGFYCRSGAPTIANCIFSGNNATGLGDEIRLSQSSELALVYSNVAGGAAAALVEVGCTLIWGEGCIDASVSFVDTDGPDDDPETWEDNNYRLANGSPGIDAADNAVVPPDTLDCDEDGDRDEPIPFDLDGSPRFVDDAATPDTGNGAQPIVDMGAYEHQPEIPGDCDGSGQLNLADLASLADCMAGPDVDAIAECDCADMDFDGDSDLADFGEFQNAFGTAR